MGQAADSVLAGVARIPAMCDRNLRTVSTPGLTVSPDLTFQSVVNGTPESSASVRIWPVSSCFSSSRIASALGIDMSIAASVPHSVRTSQPHTVRSGQYRIRMNASDPKTYLWANLCALMGEPVTVSIDAVQRRTKIGRGTVQRIKEGSTSIGINVLTSIATEFQVEAWQLLAPSLGAGLFRLDRELRAVPVNSSPMPLDQLSTGSGLALAQPQKRAAAGRG